MNDAKQPQPNQTQLIDAFVKEAQYVCELATVRTVDIDRLRKAGKAAYPHGVNAPTHSLAGEAAQPDVRDSRIANEATDGDSIPWDDLNTLADWILSKAREGSMSSARLWSILDTLTFKAARLAVSTPPVASAFAIFFDDADMETEMFAGEGAEFAARQRYSAAKMNWNCHLFARIESSPAALSPAQAAPIRHLNFLRTDYEEGCPVVKGHSAELCNCAAPEPAAQAVAPEREIQAAICVDPKCQFPDITHSVEMMGCTAAAPEPVAPFSEIRALEQLQQYKPVTPKIAWFISNIALLLCRKHDLMVRGTDYPNENAVAAIKEAYALGLGE